MYVFFAILFEMRDGQFSCLRNLNFIRVNDDPFFVLFMFSILLLHVGCLKSQCSTNGVEKKFIVETDVER